MIQTSFNDWWSQPSSIDIAKLYNDAHQAFNDWWSQPSSIDIAKLYNNAHQAFNDWWSQPSSIDIIKLYNDLSDVLVCGSEKFISISKPIIKSPIFKATFVTLAKLNFDNYAVGSLKMFMPVVGVISSVVSENIQNIIDENDEDNLEDINVDINDNLLKTAIDNNINLTIKEENINNPSWDVPSNEEGVSTYTSYLSNNALSNIISSEYFKAALILFSAYTMQQKEAYEAFPTSAIILSAMFMRNDNINQQEMLNKAAVVNFPYSSDEQFEPTLQLDVINNLYYMDSTQDFN
ncbi:hypothetical protein NF27_IN00010 [Candidatus Jidaibacter acanthamoeba]|uniref:Uncharacterized protein n=2 Tax=Candidatus Jidaibacter acanthamoebae TaxID=86105 RepID=A0A0C1QW85_9RICK|nr:hypothetical protein NF27_IN00010 [Candidatus Jidaibacter acanthamoeba]